MNYIELARETINCAIKSGKLTEAGFERCNCGDLLHTRIGQVSKVESDFEFSVRLLKMMNFYLMKFVQLLYFFSDN